MSFYPENYEYKETPSDYMKITEGEHKVRVLAPVIIGFESWKEEDGKKSPQRFKTFQEAIKVPSKDGSIKEFHAFIVWDYAEKMVRLLNITQKTLQKSIYTYATNPKWGDPTNYDINITRVGKAMDTEYSLTVDPKEPMAQEIKEAFKMVKIVPENYFTGGHPIVRDQVENNDTQSQFITDVNDSLGEDTPF